MNVRYRSPINRSPGQVYFHSAARWMWGIFVAWAAVAMYSCSELPAREPEGNDPHGHTPSIRGISFVGCPVPSDSSDFADVKDIHANYVALMPFAYGDMDSHVLHYKDLSWQWWGESPEGVRTCIRLARAQNIQCMIKPQIWFDFGVYTGNFELDSEEKWSAFEEDYQEWILSYAAMASEEGAAVVCIGTELDRWVQLRPLFWKNLITEVRKVFSGKLTYACNWDCTDKVSFWKELDYIGIDAYFPLSEAATPDSLELAHSWRNINTELAAMSDSVGRKIVFTEWGYQSTDHCGRRPWEFGQDGNENVKAQLNCYRALIENCGNQSWFEGGFLWKWFPESARGDRHSSDPYSPQDKPAEQYLLQCWKDQATGDLN